MRPVQLLCPGRLPGTLCRGEHALQLRAEGLRAPQVHRARRTLQRVRLPEHRLQEAVAVVRRRRLQGDKSRGDRSDVLLRLNPERLPELGEEAGAPVIH